MCEHIRQSSRDPVLRRVASNAVQQFRGGPLYIGQPFNPKDPRVIAESCYWFAKHHMTFVIHDEMIRAIFGEHDQMQLLISPALLLRMRSMEGDCAIYTMLIAAMLQSQGVPFEIVTVAVDPAQPGVFSHVYPRAVLPQGRMPLDASHGDYPGWEVPASRQSKRQVWNESGSPVSDQAPRWSGLHGYAVARRQGLGACGVDPSSGEAWGDCGLVAPPTAAGSSWTSFIQGIGSQVTTILGRKFAPTTILQRGPNGQLIMETPGSSPSLMTNFSAATGGESLWLWGGLAVGAVILISVLKKK